jgi:integrase/recombinase XerD
MQAIKVDRSGVETYSEEELMALLKKPNIKKCSFIEYQSWVMTNFLFSTAVSSAIGKKRRSSYESLVE